MRRLVEAGVQGFIIRGNHDAESRITKELYVVRTYWTEGLIN
jgi:DNA repair exonuclease SbcCD nuclease subunit